MSTTQTEPKKTTTGKTVVETAPNANTTIGLEIEEITKETTKEIETLTEQNSMLIKTILVLTGFLFLMAFSKMQINYLI